MKDVPFLKVDNNLPDNIDQCTQGPVLCLSTNQTHQYRGLE